MNTKLVILLSSLAAAAAHAGPRTSADYSITTDTTDAGGAQTASASYINNSSTGGVTGLSTAASPAAMAKHGYIGQLYEITALQITASPLTINEGITRQLSASQILDDDSLLNLAAGTVAWSIQSGPLSGVNANGLATAGVVAQDTAATVQGTFAGLSGSLNLTVLDTIPDNFGTYAGDTLPDDWQVQYFGVDNPLAAPHADPTGGGQDNLFKYIAGLDPLDVNSRFAIASAPVPSQPGQMRIIISPVLAGRTYTVRTTTDLSTAIWPTLTGAIINDNGSERTITDPNATGPRKFYKVEITKD